MSARARLLLAALALAVGGLAAAETPEEIFDRGNRDYEAGRFREAGEAYRSVLRYGIRDPRVEYNLANAEFKQGRLGQAVLHYRRAYRMDPTNEEIRQNLELVESRLLDRVEPPEIAPPLRWLRGLQDAVGPDGQALLLLVLVWIAAALVAWCASRPGGWSPAAGWLLALLLAAILLGALSWRVTYRRLEGRRQAVVLAPAADVLAGPGQNNATLVTVHEGLTVEVRAERGDWYQVSLPNGLSGWLPRSAAEEV